MGNIKLSSGTTVTTVESDRFIPLVSSDENEKITRDNLFNQIKDAVVPAFIYRTIDLLQAANLEADEDNPTYVRCEETEYRLYKITALAPGVNDIALDNGTTATYQVEYRDNGFVVGPASSTAGALAVFSDTSGEILAEGATPTNIGNALIEITSVGQKSYTRVNADNSAELITVAQMQTDLSLPANTVSELALKAPLASPAFTGSPTAPTPSANDNDTSIATTAFVQTELLDRVQTVATFADLATTPAQTGQVAYVIDLSMSGDDGGGSYEAKSGSVSTISGIQINSATTGIYWRRLNNDRLDDIYREFGRLNSSQDITVYCDPVTGSDSNPGTLANPFQTFQHAIDYCSKNFTHKFIIDLRTSPFNRGGLPVTYDEDVLFRDLHGPMTNIADPLYVGNGLRVFGAGANTGVDNPADVLIGSITVSGCTGIATPEIFGAKIMRISPYYEQEEFVAVYGTQEAQFYNLAFASGTTGKYGVRAYGASGASVKGIDVSGIGGALWVKRGGYGLVSSMYGAYDSTQLKSLLRSDEGAVNVLISHTVTGITDPSQLMNYSYGLNYDAYGIFRARRMYFGSLANGVAIAQDAIGIGHNITPSAAEVFVAGLNAIAAGVAGVAIGSGANSGTQSSNVAIGQGAATTGSGGNVGRRSVAIGASSSSLFENSIGLGYQATPSAANRAKIGNASLLAVDTQTAFEVLVASGSFIAKSPDGTRYKLTPPNGGGAATWVPA